MTEPLGFAGCINLKVNDLTRNRNVARMAGDYELDKACCRYVDRRPHNCHVSMSQTFAERRNPGLPTSSGISNVFHSRLKAQKPVRSSRQCPPQFTMNVLTVTGFAVLVLVHLGSASEQQPQLTRCSAKPEYFFRRGAQDVLLDPATLGIGSFLKIVDVTADYKRLAKKVELNAAISVNRTFGSSPTLEIYVSAVGKKLRRCNLSASPEELSLCGGTTHAEKKLASEWGNECPIQVGTYNSELSFKVRPSRTAKSCLKEDPLLVTLKIRDEGVILDCVSFRVATHH